MTTDQKSPKDVSEIIKTSASLKMFLIGCLIIILLIPAAMIGILIDDRESRHDSVVKELSQKWGNSQSITGPFITVPFKSYYKDANNKEQFNIYHLNFLPQNLRVTGNVKPEVRYRGLYEAVLYNAKVHLAGNFKLPPADQINVKQKDILWNKAYLSIGITDLRGVKDTINISFNKNNYEANPGLITNDIVATGVGAQIKTFFPNENNDFSFDLDLNGSKQLNFVPVANNNTVKIDSTWPSPSFAGAFLPASRKVSENGFSANWKVLNLNRNYPQFWENGKYKVSPSKFGVQFSLTADIYQKSMRLIKYSIMFIVFTFFAFFVSEIINKRRVHPIQYILIGLAVLLFYTLLLALSEYIGFNIAYIISALTVALIISAYSKAILNSKFALNIAGILIFLYSYLFIILQLEDYALIMGSIGLLALLAVVMYVTRKINWYAIEMSSEEN